MSATATTEYAQRLALARVVAARAIRLYRYGYRLPLARDQEMYEAIARAGECLVIIEVIMYGYNGRKRPADDMLASAATWALQSRCVMVRKPLHERRSAMKRNWTGMNISGDTKA